MGEQADHCNMKAILVILVIASTGNCDRDYQGKNSRHFDDKNYDASRRHDFGSWRSFRRSGLKSNSKDNKDDYGDRYGSLFKGYDGDDKFGLFKGSDGEFWRRLGSSFKDYDGDDKFGPFKGSDGEFWRRFGSSFKDYDGDDKLGSFKDSDDEFWRRFRSAFKVCDEDFEKRFGSSEDGHRFGPWFRDSDKDHKYGYLFRDSDREYGHRYGPSSKNFGHRYRSQFRNSGGQFGYRQGSPFKSFDDWNKHGLTFRNVERRNKTDSIDLDGKLKSSQYKLSDNDKIDSYGSRDIEYKLNPSSVDDGLFAEKEDDKSFNKNNYDETTTYRSIYDKKDEENKYVGISI